MARPTQAINPALHRYLQPAENGFRPHFSGGFTLAECLIASVVLAVTVLGISGALSAANRQMNAMEVEAHCLSLARDLMEQTASRAFDPPASNDHPGWSTGDRQRTLFDNIADFNGMLEDIDPAVSPVRLAETLEYSRAVSVQFRATPAGAANALGDFAVITVTITPSAHAEPFQLRRVVARSTIVRD